MTARAFVPSTLLGAAMSDNTAYPVPALHKKKPRLFIPPGLGVRASRTPLILRYRSLRVARKRASGISERSRPHHRATRSPTIGPVTVSVLMVGFLLPQAVGPSPFPGTTQS